MSPEIQNRGTSGPKIGHVYVYDKNIKKRKKYKLYILAYIGRSWIISN